jgi:putative ABC transport system permease protein
MARRGELAIRASLGASRWRLCRQLLIEGILLSAIGAAAGLLVAHWAVPALVALGGDAVPRAREIALGPGVAVWTVACAWLATLIFGGVPALVSARLTARQSSGSRRGSADPPPGRRVMSVLAVAEIAIALVLVSATGLMLRSLARAARVDVGFEPAGVLSASLSLPVRRFPDQVSQARFVERYLESLGEVPGLGRAAILMRLPLAGYAAVTFRPRGQAFAQGDEPWADYRTASEETFSVLRVPLVAGRVFTAADTDTAPDVVVVNETLARRSWPGEDPLGRQVHLATERTRWRTVVGVVGDVHMASLEHDVRPAIYVPYRQNSWPNALAAGFLLLRPPVAGGDPLPAARRVLRDLDPHAALADGRPLDDLVRGSLARRRFTTVLFACFGAFGYVLAVLGVYGVVSNTVTGRGYELAVRAALGEPRRRAFLDVVRQGLLLAAAGCAAGILLALPLAPRVAGQLYGVAPWDRVTVAATIALLVVVSIAACVAPARRAVAAEPLRAMRGEA